VHPQTVNRSAEFIGRLQAIQSVDVRARIEGYLQQVAFKNGQDVRKGDLLYQIEAAPYEAAVAAAKAQVASAQATLLQNQQNLQRQQQLFQRGNTAEATLQQAQAQRDVSQANVAAAQAQLKTAEINLGYTRIVAPIAGRIGATAVTAGNLVNASTGTLATIVELDPIRVVFSINERDFVAYKEKHKEATQQQINARFVPTLRLPDGSSYGEAGNVAFVDNRVDPATGTLAVYADFPNPQRVLLPGMLVTAIIRPETPPRGFLVPAGAVQQDKQGRFVLVVGASNKIERRAVETAQTSGQNAVIASGLKDGDRVVVEGAAKVRPGETVNAVPEGAAPGQAPATAQRGAQTSGSAAPATSGR
jgi:membrane fusion protein (multidrug efflux system)